MAISKRLRFEILRRDNHTCYYCGRKPPEVEITIDHVLPQALGGTDEASNLVAACRECNGGKTSIAPGSPLVEQVNEDAIRWSAAMQAAIKKAEKDHEATATYREEFYSAWNSYRYPAPLEENWRQSVENFRTRGLPIGLLTTAVHRAMGMPQVKPDMKFRYMCKVAWNRIREIEKDARAALGASAPAGMAPMERDAIFLDAIVSVWRATYLEMRDAEPGAAMLAEVREAASALLEYDYFLHDLFAGAQEAACRQSADIETHIPLSLGEGAVLQYLWGWMHADGAEAPFNEELHHEIAGQVGIAELAGYSEDHILEAAFHAGADHNSDLLSRLATLDGILAFLKTDEREAGYTMRGHRVEANQLEYLWERARGLYAEKLKHPAPPVSSAGWGA